MTGNSSSSTAGAPRKYSVLAAMRYSVSETSTSWYGPEPILWLTSFTCGPGTVPQMCWGMIGTSASTRTGKDGLGALSLIVTPSVPLVVIESTDVRSGGEKRPDVLALLVKYSYVNFTSSAVRGRPSCHLMLGRS